MVEKVVQSLQDLEEALSIAARNGGCRIRVGNRVAALVPGSELDDTESARFLSHPAVARRLNQAAQSLDEGKGIPHGEVLHRLGIKDG